MTGLLSPMPPKQHFLARKTSVCPPIDVPPTIIPYHLQYSVPESFPAPLSDSSAPTLFSPYSAFLGDQIMPNGTSCYPQPGIYPIPVALPPAFPLHMYNPPMPYSYTSNPLSLPQTPTATRHLEPHANSTRYSLIRAQFCCRLV